MAGTTTNYGLQVYDSGDTSTTFLAFRLALMASSSSNMTIIDGAMQDNADDITVLQAKEGVILVDATHGGSGAYAATGVSAISAYAEGMIIGLIVDVANPSPGTATLNINSLGLRSLKKMNISSGLSENLSISDLTVGKMNLFRYDSSVPEWVWIGNPNRFLVKNIETLSGQKTLAYASPEIQVLDPNGANRDVLLPPETVQNKIFVIRNSSTGIYNLIVKDDSDTNVIGTITHGNTMSFYSSGTAWYQAFSAYDDAANIAAGGRLTLETGVPVSTSDQTGKSRIYFTPFKGNTIGLYNTTSGKWEKHIFQEIYADIDFTTTGDTTISDDSITDIPDTSILAVGMRISGTGIPASTTISSIDSATAITISQNATATGNDVTLTLEVPAYTTFDIFIYDDAGTKKLQFVLYTASGEGGGTKRTAITTQDGIRVLTGALNKRYVGMGRTGASHGNIQDSKQFRHLASYINPVRRDLYYCPGYNDNSTNTSYVRAGAGSGWLDTYSGGLYVDCLCTEPGMTPIIHGYGYMSYASDSNFRAFGLSVNSATNIVRIDTESAALTGKYCHLFYEEAMPEGYNRYRHHIYVYSTVDHTVFADFVLGTTDADIPITYLAGSHMC